MTTRELNISIHSHYETIEYKHTYKQLQDIVYSYDTLDFWNRHKFKKLYRKLPKSVIDGFKNYNCGIYIMKDANNEVLKNEYNGRTLFMSTDNSLSVFIPESCMGILHHEFGHVFDFVNDVISDTEEFQEAYEKEKSKAQKQFEYSDYLISTPQEYLAQVFADYLTYPRAIKYTLPLTTKVIEKYLKA